MLTLRGFTPTHWVGVTFSIIAAIGIAADLILVYTGHDSISWRTWIAESLHPTIIGAGILGGTFLCYAVRKSWIMVTFTGVLTGHLFLHW